MTISGEGLDAVVAEAVAGNRDALRTVLETIRPIIVRYCRARIGTADRSGLSADDVAQEVCLAAITALPGTKWPTHTARQAGPGRPPPTRCPSEPRRRPVPSRWRSTPSRPSG